MRMWKTFVEPMLGISRRAHGAEDMEEGVKVKAAEGNLVEGGGGSEGDETSSGEGGGSGMEGEGMHTRVLGGTNGDGERAAGGGARTAGECVVAENADTGAGEHGSDGAHEASVRGVGLGAAEGTAARTEGTGARADGAGGRMEGTAARTEGSVWLHAENRGAKQSSVAGGRGGTEGRSKGGLGDGRAGSRCVIGDSGADGNNLSGGGGAVDREEGELSPCSEEEERTKVNYNPGGGAEENGTVTTFVHDEEEGEGVGGTEMDHDQG